MFARALWIASTTTRGQTPCALLRRYRPGQESSLPEDLSLKLAKAFARAPQDTSKSIVDALDTEQRLALARALLDGGVSLGGSQGKLDEAYVAGIFETADVHHPKGLLDRYQVCRACAYTEHCVHRNELRRALDLHRELNPATAKEQPVELTATGLSMIALAAGIPFIGFGFMDNALMVGCGVVLSVTLCHCACAQLMAGEEIDSLFGASWGLSKLAAAGLGNIVADVVGVGCADRIEVRGWVAWACQHASTGLGAPDKVDCATQAGTLSTRVVFSAGYVWRCARSTTCLPAQRRGWVAPCWACRLAGSWAWRPSCGSTGDAVQSLLFCLDCLIGDLAVYLRARSGAPRNVSLCRLCMNRLHRVPGE